MRHRAFTTLICLVLSLVGACEQTDRAERFRERQRRSDPPELWSAEVVSPERAGPITICADTFLREGFVRPLPSEGGKQCALQEPPLVTGEQTKMYCTLNGRDYVVQATLKGDPKTAFELNYSISSDGYAAHQTRRYRRLGPCPAGWEIGDNTDRQGRLRKNALH